MLVEQFGPSGRTLAERARGIDPTPVTGRLGGPKSISRETTFETNLIDRSRIKAMLSCLLERACHGLRDIDLLARTVTVKVRYADFRTLARSRSLPTLSDHDDAFWLEGYLTAGGADPATLQAYHDFAATVPEPATLGLVAAGAVGMALRRRRDAR